MRSALRTSATARQCGLTLVELMVGITVGMIVVAGASLMMTSQITDHRRLVLETQVQQDLRAAAHLLLRDLRRTGFWAFPERLVWDGTQPLALQTVRSNYGAISALEDENGFVYNYSRADDRGNAAPSYPENNAVDALREEFGFRLSTDKVLQFKLGGRWQPLTDPATLEVTDLRVTINTQDMALEEFCPRPCPAGAVCDPFVQQIRHIDVRLEGRAVHDPKVVRSVRLSTRLRNDVLAGECPP